METHNEERSPMFYSNIHSFIHSSFYVLGTFQGAEDTMVNKTGIASVIMELRI